MVMKLILESLGLAVDKVKVTTKTWFRHLLWSLAAALILFGIGWASATTFLLKAGIILLLVIITGIVAVVLFAAAAVRAPVKGITGSAGESIEAFTGFLFWLLSLVVLLLIFPIWSNPGAVLLLLVLSLIFALSYARFGIGLSPRWAVSRNAVIFVGTIVITIATAVVPELKTIVKERLISLGEALGETIAEPKKLEYSLANIDELKFFNSVNGKPKIFYQQLKDGSYVLYDGNGFSPDTREQLQPATPDLKQKIKEYLEAKAKEKEEEARLKDKEQKLKLVIEQKKIHLPDNKEPPVLPPVKVSVLVPPELPKPELAQPVTEPEVTQTQNLNRIGVLVRKNTGITVRLSQPLNPHSKKAGDKFDGFLENDLVVDSYVVLPQGARVLGRIIKVVISGNRSQPSEIILSLDQIQFGKNLLSIASNPVSIRSGNGLEEDLLIFRTAKEMILESQ